MSVVENDLSHDASSRPDWWKVAKLIGLDVDVVSNVLGNGGGVSRCSTSLAVNSLMDWLQLVGAGVADEHRVG